MQSFTLKVIVLERLQAISMTALSTPPVPCHLSICLHLSYSFTHFHIPNKQTVRISVDPVCWCQFSAQSLGLQHKGPRCCLHWMPRAWQHEPKQTLPPIRAGETAHIVPFNKYFRATCTSLKAQLDLGIRNYGSRSIAPGYGPALCNDKSCKETACTKLLYHSSIPDTQQSVKERP